MALIMALIPKEADQRASTILKDSSVSELDKAISSITLYKRVWVWVGNTIIQSSKRLSMAREVWPTTFKKKIKKGNMDNIK